MHKISLILPIMVAFFLFGLMANAHASGEPRIANVQISNPYSFATASSQKNGVVLFTIQNNAQTDLRLIHAYVKSDIADRAELHTHIMDGDKMMMRQVDGYDIPAGEDLTLAPMGDHIMLMELIKPLNVGDTLKLTLNFEDGSMAQFDVPIIAPGTKPEGSTQQETQSHDHQDHSHH